MAQSSATSPLRLNKLDKPMGRASAQLIHKQIELVNHVEKDAIAVRDREEWQGGIEGMEVVRSENRIDA